MSLVKVRVVTWRELPLPCSSFTERQPQVTRRYDVFVNPDHVIDVRRYDVNRPNLGTEITLVKPAFRLSTDLSPEEVATILNGEG